MSMFSEPPSFSETLARRKESARNTLRSASSKELHALMAELFADGTSPFAEAFANFIDEHRSESAVRGETSDGVGFVYYPRADRGMWYKYDRGALLGVGVISENSRKALSELCIVAGHF
jgi:hypothetical protein